MVDEKALGAALNAIVPGGGPVWDYFGGNITAADAEEIGIKLAIPGRWHWHSEVRGDEVRDTLKAVLGSAITAYLQALSPGSTGEAEGWRDIKSAPKDGTRILLWDGTYCRAASWSDDYYTLQNGWLECSGAEGWQSWVSEVIAPTHWRPLHAPPSAMLSAAGER